MTTRRRFGLVIAALVVPVSVFAHAGVMKTSGGTDVVLYQTPISPFVGENVRLTFILTKHDSNDQRRDFPVTFRLIDTYPGDESKDKVILEKQLRTDVNGSFQYAYAFPRENYFDVELDYAGDDGSPQTVGFLIQARTPNGPPVAQPWLEFVGCFLLGCVVTAILRSRRT